MILTYKVKHNRDFSDELVKAKKVAEYGIKTRSISSADVKHIGLKSTISNQILRKYVRDKKAKNVHNVPLIIPNTSFNVNRDWQLISIPCLNLELFFEFEKEFEKINLIEINSEYAFLVVTVKEKPLIQPIGWVGVDRNTTGHCVVVANPQTGKVTKMGKEQNYIHLKYNTLCKKLRKKGKYGVVKRIDARKERRIRDSNHKLSKKIVEIAKENNSGIRLENLKGINARTKVNKSFRGSLNSWSYYQLQLMIEYKAKLHGIPVQYIAPQYTSQLCSRCGRIGTRNGKKFKCFSCGHVDHADSNASFNIALRSPD